MQYVTLHPCRKKSVGKPRKRWSNDEENGIRGGRKTARDTGVWKLILKKAKVVRGQYSQRRRTYTVQYECKIWFLNSRLRIWAYYKVKITVM
jgi:hypothetical protein